MTAIDIYQERENLMSRMSLMTSLASLMESMKSMTGLKKKVMKRTKLKIHLNIRLIMKVVRPLRSSMIDMILIMKRINQEKKRNQPHVLKKNHVVKKVGFQI